MKGVWQSMDPLDALILGIIQGITEWLPISSSGHLVIAEELLGLDAGQNLVFDLVVHLGSILAVTLFFRVQLASIVKALFIRKDARGPRENDLRTLGLLLLVATIPAAILGVLLTGVMEDVFSLPFVGIGLIINAGILYAAWRFWSNGSKKNADLRDSIVIGLFQAVAILPGISRSGSAISGGLFRGLEREVAAVFAFLLSVPTLLGAFVYGIITLETYDTDLASAAIGFVASFLVGLASIGLLLQVLKKGQLWMFAVYCMIVGVTVTLFTI